MLILGHGSIGRAVEARLAPFGVTVTGVARRARPGVHTMSEAHALAAEADVVVALLPLTPETDGIIDGAFLDAMRPGALLVNAGRGRHVVTDDLMPGCAPAPYVPRWTSPSLSRCPMVIPLFGAPACSITPHVAG